MSNMDSDQFEGYMETIMETFDVYNNAFDKLVNDLTLEDLERIRHKTIKGVGEIMMTLQTIDNMIRYRER